MKTPATKFFLTIEFDKLWVKFNGTHGGEHSRSVRNLEDLRQFFVSKANEAKMPVDDLTILASSTLDFPTEFTSNADTIALANEIRG